MIGICAICEIEHDLELLANGEEENTVWEEYLCPITGETFTHLHSPTPLAPDRAKRAAKSKPSASKRSKSGAAGKA